MRELTREQVEYAVGRLVRLVESRGIKQTQLEQTSDVNQSTISKIFSGWQEPGADKYTPSEEVLTKLFSAIGLKLSNILNEADRFRRCGKRDSQGCEADPRYRSGRGIFCT
jgi:transcriptional regulator with XRE-family HTH domain